MGIEFPITVRGFLTVLGLAVFSTLLVSLWFKQYLKDWRFTNLLALAISLALSFLAQFIISRWRPSAEALFAAFLIGFFGTTLGCWGYEAVFNLLGALGVGKRSDQALAEQARKLLSS